MESGQRILRVVMLDVQPDYEEEFNRWYNEEHLKAILQVPGVLSGRRYRVLPSAEGDGGPTPNLGGPVPKYLALYEHESLEVHKREEFMRAAYTPWTKRLLPHMRSRMRANFAQILPETTLPKLGQK